MSEATEATKVLEGIKNLTAEEPPVLDVKSYTERVTDAAVRNVVEPLSAQPPAELGLPESDAVTTAMPSEKPTTVSTVSAPAPAPVLRQAVLLPAEPILLSAEVVSLLRASLRANLSEVTNKVLRVVLND